MWTGQVPAGSILDVKVTASTGNFGTADSVLQQVGAAAQQDGSISIRSTNILGSLWNEIAGTLLSLSPNQPFQVEILLQTNVEFSSPDDALSVLDAYFKQVSGYDVSTYSVVSVTPPGGTTQSTGEPSPDAAGPGGSSGTGTDIVDSIKAFFDKLSSTATALVVGAVVVILLILLLVAYGPNVKSIASAV